MSTENRRVFFTMVRHPIKGWTRVGNAYATRKAAADWASCAELGADVTRRFRNARCAWKTTRPARTTSAPRFTVEPSKEAGAATSGVTKTATTNACASPSCSAIGTA